MSQISIIDKVLSMISMIDALPHLVEYGEICPLI